MLSLLKSFTKRQLARKFSQNTHFRYIMLTKTLLRPIQIPSTHTHTHKIANLAKKGTTWGGGGQKKGTIQVPSIEQYMSYVICLCSNTARRYHFFTYGINFNTIITKESHKPHLYHTSNPIYQTSIYLYQASIYLYQTSTHLYQTSIYLYQTCTHLYQTSTHLYQTVFDPLWGRK